MTTHLNRLLLAISAVTLGACASAPSTPDGEPYVRGTIASLTHHATGSGMLVRAGPGSQEACGISAALDARTRVFRRNATGRLDLASIEALRVGESVDVYVSGPVAESCPAQGRASSVVITGAAP